LSICFNKVGLISNRDKDSLMSYLLLFVMSAFTEFVGAAISAFTEFVGAAINVRQNGGIELGKKSIYIGHKTSFSVKFSAKFNITRAIRFKSDFKMNRQRHFNYP
jgi:hypothetical protein